MTFYGSGAIWDPKERRVIASFVGGVLSTDDERVIALARLNGFQEAPPAAVEVEREPLPVPPVPAPAPQPAHKPRRRRA